MNPLWCQSKAVFRVRDRESCALLWSHAEGLSGFKLGQTLLWDCAMLCTQYKFDLMAKILEMTYIIFALQCAGIILRLMHVTF